MRLDFSVDVFIFEVSEVNGFWILDFGFWIGAVSTMGGVEPLPGSLGTLAEVLASSVGVGGFSIFDS